MPAFTAQDCRSNFLFRATMLSLAFFACACSNPAPAAAHEQREMRDPDEAQTDLGTAPEKDAGTKSAIEERLITELSPTNDLAGSQRNAIINRAIDQHYDVYAAPEGYFYEILSEGEFGTLDSADIVSVHYRGNFLDGREFDNSRKRGQPIRFRVGEMIDAWNLGLQRIQPGGSLRIITPSSLAYGADGLVSPRGDTLVPANAVLEFVIDDILIFEE